MSFYIISYFTQFAFFGRLEIFIFYEFRNLKGVMEMKMAREDNVKVTFCQKIVVRKTDQMP